jgi:hypothetical protein
MHTTQLKSQPRRGSKKNKKSPKKGDSKSKAPPKQRGASKKTKQKTKTKKKENKNSLSSHPVIHKITSEHDSLVACAHVIVRVFKLFNICTPEPSQVNKAVEATVKRWLVKAQGIGWIKFMKYKLAAFFAFHLNQSLPEKPSNKFDDDLPGVLLGGIFGRACRAFLHRNPMIEEGADLEAVTDGELRRATKRLEFLSTILNSKGGMPLASLEEKDKKVKKTVIKLTTPDEVKIPQTNVFDVSWADRTSDVDFELNDFTLGYQLRRTVREALRNEEYTYEERTRMLFPSTRSNSDDSLADGGTVGTLLRKEILEEFRVPGGPMGPIQQVDLSHRTQSEELDYTDSSKGMVDDELQYYTYDRDALQNSYTQAWQKVLFLAEQEEALAKAVGLLEALKIRVISKGPPLTYMALHSLQKKLHTVLRRKRCFQLIGKPDDAWILQEILGKELREGELYLSGDYTAATDNFRTFVSNTIADEIGIQLKLDARETLLFKKALTEHIFEHEGELLAQQSGQLMGSIVSFPVLCLGNFAIARWALEIATGKRHTLNHSPIGVNGDDLVMRGPANLRKVWATIGKFAGLEESIGKTFFSKKFCNINSRTYLRTKPIPKPFESPTKGTIERESVFEKTKFVNMGILLGYKKSVNTEELNMFDRRWNASAVSHALVNEAPEHMRKELFATWLGGNKDQLDKIGLPWFIPEWLGGVGLPIEFGTNDATDLKIARRIVMNYGVERPLRLSSPGSPWFIRQMAGQGLPPTESFLDPDAGPVKALERLQGDLSMNLLFDSDIPLAKIFREVRGNPFKGALKHNRKLWRRKAGKNEERPQIGGDRIDTRLLSGAKRYPGLFVKPLRSTTWPAAAEQAKSMKDVANRLKKEDKMQEIWMKIQNDPEPTPLQHEDYIRTNEHNSRFF